MRLKLLSAAFLILSLFTFLSPSTPSAYAATASNWNPGYIIDDAVFNNKSAMSVAEIQSFLNSKVPVCDTNHAAGPSARGATPPWTCLKDYYENPNTGANNLNHNPVAPGMLSAAQLIYNVSQQFSINPQVLLVTLQKESAGPLLTDTWPYPWQYLTAMGFACPDTDANNDGQPDCNPAYFGFYKQIYQAGRHLRNFADQKNDATWFTPYTVGNNYVQYNPNAGCGGTTVNIKNGATAALYSYTPYQPNTAALNNLYGTGDGCSAYGNRNFWVFFNDWFGSTYYNNCRTNGANLATPSTGRKIIGNKAYGGKSIETLSLQVLNQTGTGCIESHVWANATGQQWVSHISSNWRVVDPADSDVIAADTNGDGRDELYLLQYRNTSSGMIELHGWSSDMQRWISHTATNRPAVNPADTEVIAADTNGDGRDEFFFLEYRNNGSGRAEVHGWSPNLQQWVSHIATNYNAIDPTNSKIIAADTNGDGRDEFFLTQIASTASQKIEVHGWTPNFQQWVSHIATNRAIINPADGTVLAADTNGDGRDEFFLVQYKNTGSGRMEIHGWSANLQSWVLHSATNQPGF